MTIKTALSLAALLTAISLAVYPALSAAHSGHNKTEASAPEGYQLVWADEFNTDGLPDREKWNYDTYRNKDGWWNEEEQYYSDSRAENARVEDGHLIIEARKDAEHLRGFPEYAEQLKGYADYGGQHYSSARLFTKGKASWHYGYFEIRAKCPVGAAYGLPFGPCPKRLENGPIAAKLILWNMSDICPKPFTPPYIQAIIIMS
jgi:beta-glucanase (GH16 family)